jgi:hypothetical protein
MRTACNCSTKILLCFSLSRPGCKTVTQNWRLHSASARRARRECRKLFEKRSARIFKRKLVCKLHPAREGRRLLLYSDASIVKEDQDGENSLSVTHNYCLCAPATDACRLPLRPIPWRTPLTFVSLVLVHYRSKKLYALTAIC